MRRMELEMVATGELIRRLVENLQVMLDRQVRLVREEARENIGDTVRGSELLIVGGLLLYAGGIMLLVFLAFALASVVPPWVTALALGLILAMVGAILAFLGKQRVATRPLQKTRESLEEDLAWARRQLSSSER